MPPKDHAPDADTAVSTLANGVRVVTIDLPQVETASVSVFVRTGSRHESRRLNGISHVVEHMAFKGTTERDCQRINLDAERLGADVNAHTDRDHTAFHMSGLAVHAPQFVHMLADIVRESRFPADELERERQVILHEYAEDEDDALSTAFKLFDRCCYGTHPVAQPIIGTRANIERFSRDDLLDYVARQYSGANLVVGVAGRVDHDKMVAAVEAAFGSMPRGEPNRVEPAPYAGGHKTRAMAGYSQTHVVLGFPVPALGQGHEAAVVAAALFGEGMSSPLLDQLRERRGLVYYAGCSADLSDLGGQFVVEASTGPEHVDEFFTEVTRLLTEHAERSDAVGLERARNQITVRSLRALERPQRRLEDAAQDLFVFDRVRARAEVLARLQAVSAAEVRECFATMLRAPAALALAGKLKRSFAQARWLERFGTVRAA